MSKKKIGFILFYFSFLIVFGCSKKETSNNQSGALEENDLVLGNSQAKITVVEYFDLQCPACKQFNELIYKKVWRLIQKDVKWVFRHYPLKKIHSYAEIAAQYSEAANSQGKFIAFHDLLFQKQEEWSKLGSESKVEEKFMGYAQSLGLDPVQLKELAHSREVQEKINQDIDNGNKQGVEGTPSLFINGDKISVPRSAEIFFKDIISQIKAEQGQ